MSNKKNTNKSNNSINNNNNSIKECETKFCKLYLPMYVKKMLAEFREQMVKKFTKKMSPSEKKDFYEKEKKKLMKKSKSLKKEEKKNFDDCMNTYCNKGCKNTIYEDGDGNIFPASLERQLRSNLEKHFNDDKKFIENIIDSNKKQRIDIFKNKTSVLKDSFYKKINKKTLKLLKNKKAVSCCGYINFEKI